MTTYFERTGITRKLDNLGRLVVPIEFRRELGFEPKTQVEFMLEDDVIFVQKTVGTVHGLTRKLDSLGRIIIPSNLRQRLNIADNAAIDISIHEDGVRLRKAVPVLPRCVVTGRDDVALRPLQDGTVHLSIEGCRILLEEFKDTL